MNQWKLFLQKNLNNITQDCLSADFDRNYFIEIKDFMKVIDRRTRVPEYLKQENGDLLHEFISSYTDDQSGKVDYRSLIEELRFFNYEEANAHKGGEPEHHSQSVSRLTQQRKKTIFEDEYIVLDSQKVPPNVLDQIEEKLVKVSRFLKRTYGNDKTLDQALKESCSVQDKNNNISVDDLKNFVLDTCKDQIIHRKISKKDVEAFLSAFNYNTYGATNLESISKVVFTNENYVA